MPELPDVETYRRYLNSTALHQRIKNVAVNDAAVLREISARSLQTRLKGHEFKSTRRHGKNLFVEVTGRKEWLLLHFGMSGSLAYYNKPEEGPDHARVVFEFTNDHQLAYDNPRKIGKVSLVDNVDRYLRENDIGPDALRLKESEFVEHLGSRKGSIKPSLMDQSLIAGIGNIYADELLFQTGIHPESGVNSLDPKTFRQIHRSMRKMLKKALECQAELGRLPRKYLLPHRHPKGKCPRCGTAWNIIKVSGRTTYFCPSCQRKS